MPALSFRMNKHSLHNSMALGNRLVLRRKPATMRPTEMTCVPSAMLFMSNVCQKKTNLGLTIGKLLL